jgi:hypothetical protein
VSLYNAICVPDVRKLDLLMSSVFCSTCPCEQLFSAMKKVKSGTRTHLTDKYLETCESQQ